MTEPSIACTNKGKYCREGNRGKSMIYDWRLCIVGEDGFMGGIVVMDLQQKDVFLHISDTYALISQLNWFILVHILYAP